MKKMMTMVAVIAMATAAGAETYHVDLSHADVGFKVKHLGVSNVRGHFSEVEGTIDYDGKSLSSLRIAGTIKAASVNTGNEKRDKHLRSDEFFDIENHTDITFATKGVHAHGNSGHLVGEITIKGITKEIELNISISGPVDSPFAEGVKIVGLSATGKLNRQDFGVANDGMSDGLIGDEVTIEISLEGTK